MRWRDNHIACVPVVRSIRLPSASNLYDFFATRGVEERFIEVKGTIGEGLSIILTHGEVKHGKNNPLSSALVVVAKILDTKSGNSYVGSKGVVILQDDPWTLDDSMLEPTEYRFSLK